MSAHVTMRRQDRQDETTEELPEKNQRELKAKGNHCHPRDLIAVSAVQTRPSTESRALLTNQKTHVTNFIRMLSGNVSVNVFKSDAVFWWAAISRTPSSMFDKMLHLSKSQGDEPLEV